jgi:hypothetical protein
MHAGWGMAPDLRRSEELKADIQRALSFYASFYESVGSWTLWPGKIEPVLGKNEIHRCRFCGGYPPVVSFRQQAHAIPEALGNKTLFISYECDNCNQRFGCGIENDLGNWSKPMRTLGLISGKSGIPTLKGKSPKEWRVEGTQAGLHLKHHSEDVVAIVDEVEKTMILSLPRDSYTPRAVFKAFTKGPVAGLVGIEGGVVSEVINLESSGVRAPDRRPRHDQQYHEDAFPAG